MSGIWVVLEERQGSLSRISMEAIAAAQQLGRLVGQPVHAVIPGAQTDALAEHAAAFALAGLIRLEHPLLAPYTPDGFTLALEQLLRAREPHAVVFPHTYQVRDYAPALAARFGSVLIGDVTSIEPGPVFTRQLMQGRLTGTYRPSGSGPIFISVQSGAFRADQAEPGNAPAELIAPALEPAQIRTAPSEPFRESAGAVDLTSAPYIVSVGRGIREAGNLTLVENLASVLGAELAASRPICDNGWLPIERQVGSSGQTVAPKLYVAVGISGAIQHLVGIKGSQCVVAINKDADAPIFEAADYGIVGDLFDVVPALTEAIKATR